MDFHVRAFIWVVIIVIICISIFTIIYYFINKEHEDEVNRGFSNSLYTAITVQTNIGMKNEPQGTAFRYLIMVQSLLSYIITLGFAYVILKFILRDRK